VDNAPDFLMAAFVIGVGATAVMDLWGIVRTRWLGMPAANYALIGRWFAYLARGRVRHHPIAATPAVRGERVLGWIAHYATGIAFAAILLLLWGVEWARHPTLVPALAVGIASVAAPFLVMQPAMGAGFAASRTPRPGAARVQSLVTHAVFGLGLYAAGCVTALL